MKLFLTDKKILKLLCMLWMLIAPLSQAQRIEPDAPVMDFTLPLFGDEGYKTWEITGHEGRYQGKDRILVLLMTIKIFSGNADMLLQTIIASPDANINLKEKTATGDSVLRVRGHNYRVSGRGWTWYGQENRIVVHHDAKVEFNQDIGIQLQ